MKRTVFISKIYIALLPVLAGLGMHAQTMEPEDPDIILPTLVVELQETQPDQVQTVLPETVDLFMPEINIELPEPGDIEVAEGVFSLDLPIQDIPDVATEASFYTRSTIGIGSMNQFLGDLTLYRTGGSPRFDLHFFHDIRDGFGFQPAGRGYFGRKDILEGSFEFRSTDSRSVTGISYIEEEYGLQEKGGFYSRVNRFYSGDTDFAFSRTNPFTFTGNITADAIQSVLSGENSPTSWAYRAVPKISVSLKQDTFTADLALLYVYRGVLPVNENHHYAALTLEGEYEFPASLSLGASAGISWSLDSGWHIPFKAVFGGSIQDAFFFELLGGYRTEQITNIEILKVHPLVGFANGLKENNEWYVSGDLQWKIIKELNLRAYTEFIYSDALLRPDFSAPDTVTGLFPLTQVPGMLLTSGAFVQWAVVPAFTIWTGWDGQFLNTDPFTDPHVVKLGIKITNPQESFGINLSGKLGLGGTIMIPEIDLDGYINVTDGISIKLQVLDIFALFYTEGRPDYGAFIKPGFSLVLTTNISL